MGYYVTILRTNIVKIHKIYQILLFTNKNESVNSKDHDTSGRSLSSKVNNNKGKADFLKEVERMRRPGDHSFIDSTENRLLQK